MSSTQRCVAFVLFHKNRESFVKNNSLFTNSPNDNPPIYNSNIHCLKMTFSIWKDLSKFLSFCFGVGRLKLSGQRWVNCSVQFLSFWLFDHQAQPAGARATKTLSNIAWKINSKYWKSALKVSQFYKKVKWLFKKVFFEIGYVLDSGKQLLFNYSFSWFKDYILNETFSDLFINFFSFSRRLLFLLY